VRSCAPTAHSQYLKATLTTTIGPGITAITRNCTGKLFIWSETPSHSGMAGASFFRVFSGQDAVGSTGTWIVASSARWSEPGIVIVRIDDAAAFRVST
jgi:hypothetical protein